MRVFLFIASLFVCSILFGQGTDHQLAEHYFSNGEFEKALTYYERLNDKHDNKFYFDRLIICLEQTGNDKEVEKLLKKAISRSSEPQEYSIQLASFYEN
ncbi:MAG: hypothetical protein EBT18_00300, partial [Gammaproteobacteria bacterium]|nr:hypothetical protein [Gammaproteobacteria bacterium]